MRPALSWRGRARSRLTAALLGLAAALPAADTGAMTVVREGTTLFASGPVVDEDFVRFKTAFAEGGLQRHIGLERRRVRCRAATSSSTTCRN